MLWCMCLMLFGDEIWLKMDTKYSLLLFAFGFLSVRVFGGELHRDGKLAPSHHFNLINTIPPRIIADTELHSGNLLLLHGKYT